MKKIIVAAAGAATMFAVTAAGAATLPLAGNGSSFFEHTVQQSDEVSATCTNGTVETGYSVTGTDVESLKVLQQYIQSCLGSEFQAVVYRADGTELAASEIERYTTPGLDIVLDFPGSVDAEAVDTMRLTIADDILAP